MHSLNGSLHTSLTLISLCICHDGRSPGRRLLSHQRRGDPPNVVQPASAGSPISSPVCACVTPLPCVTHCRHANYPPSRHADPDGNGGVRVDRNHNRIHKSQGRQLGDAGTHHTHTQDYSFNATTFNVECAQPGPRPKARCAQLHPHDVSISPRLRTQHTKAASEVSRMGHPPTNECQRTAARGHLQ